MVVCWFPIGRATGGLVLTDDRQRPKREKFGRESKCQSVVYRNRLDKLVALLGIHGGAVILDLLNLHYGYGICYEITSCRNAMV